MPHNNRSMVLPTVRTTLGAKQLQRQDFYYNVCCHTMVQVVSAASHGACLAHLSLPSTVQLERSCSCLWIWVLGTLATPAGTWQAAEG
jgi:hypothetical protein